MSLLAPAFLEVLETLRIAAGRATFSPGGGAVHTRGRGASIEFVDHRPYQSGDDIRYLDRHAYARLRRLHVKLFAVDQQVTVRFLIDASASMAYGTPPKMALARSIALALGVVALAGGDQVQLGVFSNGRLEWHPTIRGRHEAERLLDCLQAIEPSGRTALASALLAPDSRVLGPGLLVAISDWMTDPVAVSLLRALGREVLGLHLLAPEELEPERLGSGAYRLISAESGREMDVSLSRRSSAQYAEALGSWVQEIKERFAEQGCLYLMARSDRNVEELVLEDLRSLGVVR